VDLINPNFSEFLDYPGWPIAFGNNETDRDQRERWGHFDDVSNQGGYVVECRLTPSTSTIADRKRISFA
jgi:hypothetical protein|tara:strand:- start:1852 stop:2058 length:207 start_codon:yes stop_codon:yes gene_type:complete